MTSLDSRSMTRPASRIGLGTPPDEMADADWPADGTLDGALLPAIAPPAHDPTQLLAALDEIEARRAAIEWLLEAGLLSHCLS